MKKSFTKSGINNDSNDSIKKYHYNLMINSELNLLKIKI
jgi:hypothetical protein